MNEKETIMDTTFQERDLTLIEVWCNLRNYHDMDACLIDHMGRMLLTKVKDVALYGFGTTVNKCYIQDNLPGEKCLILHIDQHHTN